MIPNTHLDLLQTPVHGVLTTVMPDGVPQSSIIWVDYDGESILINTTLERQKGRNMIANPKVTILVIDPIDQVGHRPAWRQHARCLGARVDAERAEEHADKLTQQYCHDKQHFYGDIYPVEQRCKESRVIVKVQPIKVCLDAVFK